MKRNVNHLLCFERSVSFKRGSNLIENLIEFVLTVLKSDHLVKMSVLG